jgi:hypothetical protein
MDARDASRVELAESVADQIGIGWVCGSNRTHASPLRDDLGAMGLWLGRRELSIRDAVSRASK